MAAHGVYAPIIKQVFFLAAGGVCVFSLAHIDYNKSGFLYAMIPFLAIFTVFSLVYTMFFGDIINGARRSYQLLGISIQPSELAKLSIVTLLSYILAKSQKKRDISNGGLFASVLVVAFYGGMLYSSGLTNMLLLVSISASMLLIGGVNFKKFIMIVVTFAVIGGGFYALKHRNEAKQNNISENRTEQVDDPQKKALGGKQTIDRSETRDNRIKNWLERDKLIYKPLTDRNQQEMFSCMAQAHGGLLGVGVGHSRECARLPLAFSDYIYSIIIEETGLVGGLLLMLLYLWLLARAAMIVRRSTRVLPSLLIIGMASFITYQALFHMGINVGTLPVSGQPLPLISSGGSSIIVVSVAFGVMLSVSRTIANYNNKNNKVDKAVLPEGLDAVNPTQIPPKNVWK